MPTTKPTSASARVKNAAVNALYDTEIQNIIATYTKYTGSLARRLGTTGSPSSPLEPSGLRHHQFWSGRLGRKGTGCEHSAASTSIERIRPSAKWTILSLKSPPKYPGKAPSITPAMTYRTTALYPTIAVRIATRGKWTNVTGCGETNECAQHTNNSRTAELVRRWSESWRGHGDNNPYVLNSLRTADNLSDDVSSSACSREYCRAMTLKGELTCQARGSVKTANTASRAAGGGSRGVPFRALFCGSAEESNAGGSFFDVARPIAGSRKP
eukprot:284816096_2